MGQVYLAKHNKVWQNIKTGETYGDKLTLKDGEKLTDYQQAPKPPRIKNQSYEFVAEKNNENGGMF